MAKSKPQTKSTKSKQTLREATNESNSSAPKRRLKLPTKKLKHSASKVKTIAKKEYYLPVPDNKVGGFLNKKRRYFPSYFRNSWTELKLVTWPNRKTTAKLTIAVLIFAIIFGTLIAVVDYGLDKVFRQLLLK